MSPTRSYSRPPAIFPQHTAASHSSYGVPSHPSAMPLSPEASMSSLGTFSGSTTATTVSPSRQNQHRLQANKSPKRSPNRLLAKSKPTPSLSTPGGGKSEGSKEKKNTFDQNLKQIFQKGKAGFSSSGGASKLSPEKAKHKASAKSPRRGQASTPARYIAPYSNCI